MREILFFLRSRCCSSGSFSKRPSALILSSSLLFNTLRAGAHKQIKCTVKRSCSSHRFFLFSFFFPFLLSFFFSFFFFYLFFLFFFFTGTIDARVSLVRYSNGIVRGEGRKKNKNAKLVLSLRYSITCFRLSAGQFICYRVITMRRPINFANCALE